jgi:hypothetical protein
MTLSYSSIFAISLKKLKSPPRINQKKINNKKNNNYFTIERTHIILPHQPALIPP